MGVGNRYEVRGKLGAGTVGTVHEAFDPRIGRRVAIKVVRRPPPGDEDAEDVYARLQLEAQAAGGFSHPNIVAVYDFGEDVETAWIVMELVEGGSLKGLLDRGKRPPVPEAARIMRDVLAALSYSHNRGVVHRDIKPANLLLTLDGRVKVADFGVARVGDSTRTVVGTVLGTPAYMAPEQLRGEPIDHRADVWSVGVVLYELLTGAKPFPGSPASMMHRALYTEPAAPSWVSGAAPPAFDAVVARALAKRPEDRFQSAAAFAEAIRAAAVSNAQAAAAGAATPPEASAPVRARRSSPPRRPRAAAAAPGWASPRRRLQVALVGGGGAVLAAGAAAALLLRGVSGPGTPSPDPVPVARPPESSRQTPPHSLEGASPKPPPSEGPWQTQPQAPPSEASEGPWPPQAQPPPQAPPGEPQPQPPSATQPPTTTQGQSPAEAFTMLTSASVRAGPTGSAPVLRSVSRGATIRIFARSGGWLQIGDEEPWGWVHESRVPDYVRQANQTPR